MPVTVCVFILSFTRTFFFFFFNDPATTEIYTLSLHDALPISDRHRCGTGRARLSVSSNRGPARRQSHRSEEHTSELQSRGHLVCRLLLEKKKKKEIHKKEYKKNNKLKT